MIYLVVVSVIWAFSFPLIKLHLTGLDPNVVALARMVLALLALVPFLRLGNIRRKLALRFMAIGGLQMGVMYVAYIRSFQYLRSYEVALLTILTPFWVNVVSSVVSRRFDTRSYLAAGLAIAGAAVIVARPDALGPAVTGAILVQVANIAFGAGQILFKRTMASHPELSSVHVMALLYSGAVVVTLTATMMTFDRDLFVISATQGLVLAYLGIVAAGLGFLLWNVGATKVSDGVLAVMNNGYIPIAVLVGLVWLGEKFDPLRLGVGTALMILALVVARGDTVRQVGHGCSSHGMTEISSGFSELEHTADCELEVWGPDMAALLEAAAMGMYGLMGAELADGARQSRRIELETADREALLVDFLAELLYFGEAEGRAYDVFDLAVSDNRLTGTIGGTLIASQVKEIKAVTYHRLHIRETDRGLETRVVFDV